MDEDRRAQRYDNMHPDSEESRFGWVKDTIYAQYEAWAPWLEDMYLKLFTKDNKASYVTRDQLNQTKVTNVKEVDKLQDGVNDLAAGQLGQGGALEPVGNLLSKEGIDRADTRRKDDDNNKGIPIVSSLGL